MLDDIAFQLYARRLGLSRKTVALIERARRGRPKAGQTTGYGSVTGRVPSDKMGHTVGTDARTTERLAIAMYDWTDAVYEFWEQSVELRLEYADRSGRRHAFRTRTDFLVLEADGAYVDEWKTEEELLRLAETMPSRYVRDSDGWRSPPAMEAAEKLGLQFRLRTPASVPGDIARNHTFLRDYRRSTETVSASAQKALSTAVASRPGLTIAELLAACPEARPDDLYLLFARGRLYVNLAKHRLADTSYTPVFGSESLAFAFSGQPAPGGPPAPPNDVLLRPGARVEMGGRELLVVEVSEVNVTFRADGGALLPFSREEAEAKVRAGGICPVGSEAGLDETVRALRTASPKALTAADRRVRVLRDWWAGKPVSTPARTLRRWARAYREAALRSDSGFAGLVMGEAGRPAGSSSIDPVLLARVDECINEFYEVPDPPTKARLHAQIAEVLELEGYNAVGYTTVISRLGLRDKAALVGAQAGRKMAYQVKEFVSYLAFDTPKHGERPWERAHLDHTQIDLWLVDSETGLPLGRPWLTLLIDAYSRRVLAFWLTFDEPSYRSLMMVLRRCVERWGRLPEQIVVDDGAEFGGAYFEKFLGRFDIEKLVRRGDPRAGGVIERFFGTLNTRVWHALLGQTRPTKNVRANSPEVDPQKRATWTLATIEPVIEGFLFERYDTTIHPAFAATPREVCEARMEVTGLRTGRLVANNETFFFASLPTTDKGYATVSNSHGLKINHRYYQAPELKSSRLEKATVPVRYDPMDVRHAYAYIDGRWLETYCPSLRRFPAVSERVVAAISAEHDERARVSGRGRKDTAAELAVYLGRTKQAEPVLLQLRRDAEARTVGLEQGLSEVDVQFDAAPPAAAPTPRPDQGLLGTTQADPPRTRRAPLPEPEPQVFDEY
jgi:putative transposase